MLNSTRDSAKEDEQPKKRPVSKMFGRVSKFKHLKGDVILNGRMENLKNLSRSGFQHLTSQQVNYILIIICVVILTYSIYTPWSRI